MHGSQYESDLANLIREYPESWADRFARWIKRWPGSAWIYYLILLVVILLIQVISLALDGILVDPGLNRAHVFLAIAISYVLALIYYLNQFADNRLGSLRPEIKIGDDQFEQLARNLSTMPAMSAFFAGIFGLASMFLLEYISGSPYLLESLQDFQLSANVFRTTYMILWWVFGTLIYHNIHQLRIIRRISEQLLEVNLYKPKNLYTFSNQIATSSFCTALLPLGFLIANPWASWNEPAVFLTVLVVQLVALATFIWPHYGIHRLQVAEKEILLEQTNKRIESIGQVLHQSVDEGNLDGIGDLNTTLSTLKLELSIIEKIPTWPWQPETLRILVTALAFPLGVWLIQVFLGRFLGS